MSPKHSYTRQLLIFSTTVIIVGYVLSTPLLPLRRETKKTLGYPKDSLLNFTELTGKYGYTSEEHTVITEDGYILTIFRIVKAKNCIGKKRFPPVLLMHGLLLSSDAWIDSGPTSGLAYLISDGCFDLWIGNCRGNYYGRRHVSLNPDKDAKFWNFYVDEIGRYDVPATIDYVLKHTGAKKLNYIGFSQGCGSFFVMCSERPEYCEKVQVLIALAPSARQTFTRSFMYRTLCESLASSESVLSKFVMGEVFSKGHVSQEFMAFFCQLSKLTGKACESSLALFDHAADFHIGSLTNETTRNLFGHFPAGTSLHNMAWYGQRMVNDRFLKFDYGKIQNLVVYGKETPPSYDLKAVIVPVVCVYGRNDGLVDTKDVKWLMSNLPNVVEVMEVSNPLWNHLDMTYSQYSSQYILPKVNEYLYKYTTT